MRLDLDDSLEGRMQRAGEREVVERGDRGNRAERRTLKGQVAVLKLELKMAREREQVLKAWILEKTGETYGQVG